MSPEQASGDKLDARSDVYGLGVIVYRLITGAPAVWPGAIPTMLHEVVYRMPPQPSSLVEVSPHVEAVMALALAKSPSDRFASAGELARMLEAAANWRLPDAIRQRAARILAKTPWGGWLHKR